jgi:hypothetical protein
LESEGKLPENRKSFPKSEEQISFFLGKNLFEDLNISAAKIVGFINVSVRKLKRNQLCWLLI